MMPGHRQGTDVTALIERARTIVAEYTGPLDTPDDAMDVLTALADALEAVTAERDTAVAAIENTPHVINDLIDAADRYRDLSPIDYDEWCLRRDEARRLLRALAALSSSTGGA